MSLEPFQFSRDNIRTRIRDLARAVTLDGPRQLDLMVYGGSALLLASNFRDATTDIDAFIGVDDPTPVARNRELQRQLLYLQNLAGIVMSSPNNGGQRWLDTNVYRRFEESPVNLAARESHIQVDAVSDGQSTLQVYVPDKSLMLAMKVRSIRINEDNPLKKPKDLDDILNLLVLHPEIKDNHDLMAFSAKFFPNIRNNQNVIDGTVALFHDHRDRPRHPHPVYAAGRDPAP